jgi:cell division protein FtsW
MKAQKPDYILLTASGFLIALGILILISVSASISQEKFGTIFHFLNHQIFFGLLPGIILAFLLFKIQIRKLKKLAPILLLINIALLAMVFLPKIGVEIRGASRWLNLWFFSVQPSEFLKLTFILYISTWLNTRKERNFSKKPKIFLETFIAFLIIVGVISLLLIFQPDISTLGIIVLTATIMYFSFYTPLWHTALILLIGTGGLLTLIKLAPYRMNRILVFLNPETDPMGIGYQIKQVLIAVGSGGILGPGLGMSVQKFGFIPHSLSDSVFAIFAEEAGFMGSLILIILFLIFAFQGFKISKNSTDKFSQLLALGITSWIVIQGFINISSMIGILPLSGIPLPFISYGGSALTTELAGVGILLNISKTI